MLREDGVTEVGGGKGYRSKIKGSGEESGVGGKGGAQKGHGERKSMRCRQAIFKPEKMWIKNIDPP